MQDIPRPDRLQIVSFGYGDSRAGEIHTRAKFRGDATRGRSSSRSVSGRRFSRARISPEIPKLETTRSLRTEDKNRNFRKICKWILTKFVDERLNKNCEFYNNCKNCENCQWGLCSLPMSHCAKLLSALSCHHLSLRP